MLRMSSASARLCAAAVWIPTLLACSSKSEIAFSGGTGAAAGTSNGGQREAGPYDGGVLFSDFEAGATCAPVNAWCSQAADNCCEGAVCALDGEGAPRCRRTCADRVECGSLCCMDNASVGRKICVDESRCPPVECSGVGGPCDDPPLERCCEGLVCVASESREMAGCRPQCTVASDCDTDCCVPFSNADLGFCMDEVFCR